jgi:hypothetical protein
LSGLISWSSATKRNVVPFIWNRDPLVKTEMKRVVERIRDEKRAWRAGATVAATYQSRWEHNASLVEEVGCHVASRGELMPARASPSPETDR